MEKIQMKRRDFVKIVGLATGGLILGCNVSPEKIVINTLEDGISFVPNLFIQLQKDGKVTIVVARSEMGRLISLIFGLFNDKLYDNPMLGLKIGIVGMTVIGIGLIIYIIIDKKTTYNNELS